MKHKITFLTFAAALFTGIASVAQAASIGPAEKYDPMVNPADFTTSIDNPYFSIPVGKKMVYEKTTEDGKERIEILVPGWTRTVMGVKTLVFWDRVYLNGELIEDTRDYLAQHENGDVWYFGEHVDNYEDGKLKDHHGAWIAGERGAKPGIWMLADPKQGDEFRNEYYKGEAEDITKILTVSETVTVPAGTYSDCVKTFDWTPLDAASIANKYYCKQPGGTVLEVELPGKMRKAVEKSELVSIDMKGALGAKLPAAYAREGVIGNSETGVDREEGEENEREYGDVSIPVAALILGLILGVLLQKYALGRFGSTER